MSYVDIGDFTVHPANDEDLAWLKVKIERNFVDLFVERGVKTTHRASTFAANYGSNPTRVAGAVERNSPTTAEIRVQLMSRDGEIIASASVDGNLLALKENYKSIPEALMYVLRISPDTLQKVETVRGPTNSFQAMLLYLEAGRRSKLRQLEKAFALLQDAVKEDARFALAYWASGQVLRAQGNEPEAQKWEAEALKIDPDHPKRFFIGEMANPLPSLRAALQATAWRPLQKGLASKSSKLDGYGISVHAWRLESADFRMAIARSATESGSTVSETRRKHEAILAVNGGFFDIDAQSRLSPSGLLIIDGRQIAPAGEKRKGGSGVVYTRNGAVEIDFIENAKELSGIEAAVQVGPLVVDPGGKNGIRRNDFDRQSRSIICRQAQGTVVIVIVEGGLSLYEMGELLAGSDGDGGFGCDRALNLDGGPSTQASFALAGQSLEIQGRWKVPNALLVLPR